MHIGCCRNVAFHAGAQAIQVGIFYAWEAVSTGSLGKHDHRFDQNGWFSVGWCAEPVPKTKRQIAGPRPGFTLGGVKAETITAIPYDIIKEGLKT